MTGMIEKVYSQALFETGRESNTLDILFSELNAVSEILKDNPNFIKFLSAPIINADEKKSVIAKIFKDKISEYLYNFICILTDKNRIQYIGRITEEFKKSCNNYNGIMEVTVTTALPMKKELLEKLVKKLEAASGKKISIVEKVDNTILGGIILSYGNTLLDSSVKSKLESIHLQMKSVIA